MLFCKRNLSYWSLLNACLLLHQVFLPKLAKLGSHLRGEGEVTASTGGPGFLAQCAEGLARLGQAFTAQPRASPPLLGQQVVGRLLQPPITC